MLPDIWEAGLSVVFVSSIVDEQSEALGFHHLHPRDRFWELVELAGITPTRIISREERKALAEGHAKGNVSDPVRMIFMQKKTSQVIRAGIGVTTLNRRVVGRNDKEKAAQPTPEDVHEFIVKCEQFSPRVVGFLTSPEIFLGLFKDLFSGALSQPGPQPFHIGRSEVWLLGSTIATLRGEALTLQEDTFFALGERIPVLTEKAGA